MMSIPKGDGASKPRTPLNPSGTPRYRSGISRNQRVPRYSYISITGLADFRITASLTTLRMLCSTSRPKTRIDSGDTLRVISNQNHRSICFTETGLYHLHPIIEGLLSTSSVKLSVPEICWRKRNEAEQPAPQIRHNQSL
eukprot:IDg13993t1